jgi:DNA-binding NarL/FixJ family response regulator
LPLGAPTGSETKGFAGEDLEKTKIDAVALLVREIVLRERLMNMQREQCNSTESKARILVVDDHAIVREGLALLIDQEPDLSVSAKAENADEALDAINTQQIDLAIVDISLEGRNGLQLTKQIKSEYPDLPVLILTMHDEALHAKHAFVAGARGYVTKHEAAETIVAAIRAVLAGKDYLSETMTQKLLGRIHSKGSHG